MDTLSEFDKKLNALLKEFKDSISSEDMIECLEFYANNPRRVGRKKPEGVLKELLEERNSFTLVDDTFSEEDKKKYTMQRAKRGFDDTELWNLNTTICQFIIPRLEEFKEQTFGYPPGITFEEWIDIIDEMLNFFKKYVDDEVFINASEERGFKLFYKYFDYLWW